MNRRAVWNLLEKKSDDQLISLARNAMKNARALEAMDASRVADNERRLAGEIHALVNAERPHLIAQIAAELVE